MKLFLYVFLLSFLVACANVPQIDRGRFASPTMALDPHPEETMFTDSVHAYRESAIGGGKAVGGGCGCN